MNVLVAVEGLDEGQALADVCTVGADVLDRGRADRARNQGKVLQAVQAPAGGLQAVNTRLGSLSGPDGGTDIEV